MFSTRKLHLFGWCVHIFLLTFVVSLSLREENHKLVRRSPEYTDYAGAYTHYEPEESTKEEYVNTNTEPAVKTVPWYKKIGSATKNFFKSIGSTIKKVFTRKNYMSESAIPYTNDPDSSKQCYI